MSQHIGASKYSPEQRESVVVAIVEAGMTIRECMARAEAGHLVTRSGEPVGSFRLPQATAALIARTEREYRELSKNGPLHRQVPAAAIDDARTRLLRLIDKQLSKLERQSKPDLAAINDVTDAVAKVKKLLPEAPKVPVNGPGREASTTPFTDRLTRELAKGSA